MDPKDPFYNPDDADRTIVVKPNPGGQRGAQTPPPGYVPPMAPPTAAPPPPAASSPFGFGQPNYNYEPQPAGPAYAIPDNPTGPNALTDAAARLLALIGRLKITPHHNDVGGLHRQVIQEIQSFDNNSRARGCTPEAVLAARYALCACIDEAVLNTPWGSSSLWSGPSMLSTFHQETGGGEKFFQILERIMMEPAKNIALLELYSVCLALGFEGRYRIMEMGRSQLESLRDELFRTIRTYRGESERELSPHWRGLHTKMGRLRHFPLWVVAALAGAVLLGIYAGFNFILHQSSAPVLDKLNNISPEAVYNIKEDNS
jgi:type VI secretion system protein ImpK